jgi:hypothetical protein
MQCRHNKTWLLASAHIEWCYECGAIKQMQPSPVMNSTSARIGADGRKARFIKPTGKDGGNPHEKLVN